VTFERHFHNPTNYRFFTNLYEQVNFVLIRLHSVYGQALLRILDSLLILLSFFFQFVNKIMMVLSDFPLLYFNCNFFCFS